ncbi:pilus assembly protein TadG [Agrobacterium tumefaciens]|uniref:Pilus assembly protein TadG n=1 Tax=Agrobacterium tumefaciens TaxID=358 RepID=A0A2L2LBP9_AGRTU|nr:TadE/TadG family type IV pilus assembly protein [Agrobacterium tumefaciens]AVH41749.1 pilus assembly protein TadG [Agrobacterium tumefaciens]NSY95672.1 pilus assembly protein TadG [Agrobacterium tumefaciens]NSZ02151.1 pilus assembly protein TadG [Agrobacterium tumefaciens]NSZ37927.1 pilus assembly protein TadG [Agrobacterium tumefaciens]NTB22260.1 pilus assembly protein TadG [Agrobacterium tumefaciens]
MKKTTWFLRLAGFGRCRSGAAALEMGLLAPLLVLMLAVIIEVGRGWLSYDRFMTIVDDSARWAARFPEFEERVRTGVPSFVVLSGSGILQTGKLDLTLRSVKLVDKVARLQFPAHNFLGSAEDVPWEKTVIANGFVAQDAIIVVSGRYSYRPLIAAVADITLKFEYVAAVNPFFSQRYPYQSGKSDFAKWNLKRSPFKPN